MSMVLTSANHRKRIAVMITMHVLALAAPFTFTWQGLVAFYGMAFLTHCLGASVCEHRLLAHRSFKTHKWFENFLMLLGALTFQADPLSWTFIHRRHHAHSDTKQDPHSPIDGFWHSHMGWSMKDIPSWKDPEIIRQVVPELADDPWALFLARHVFWINVASFLALYALGYAWGGPKVAISVLVWGGYFRLVYVWHWVWIINGFCHTWGYRNYNTPDRSHNVLGFFPFMWGEAWHNNHHASPSAANYGHRWWELDPCYWVIWMFKELGLAWDIQPIAPTVLKTQKTTLSG